MRYVHSPLTVREIEVIRYLAKGFLYKEIADKMGISFSIVHKLQHKIFVKLHVSNRTEAINKWNGGFGHETNGGWLSGESASGAAGGMPRP